MSWKKVKLGELLEQIKQIVSIDNSKEYKLVTVSNKGIIKQREIVKGLEIKGEKAFEAKNGSFIYSRLSIHNGAFGIVPLELDGALLTSEMPIFKIGERILPEFLIYSLQLPTFKFQLEQLTKGVGRTRVKEANFLNLLIDLPEITEQKEIIKKLTKTENQCGEINSELKLQLTLVKKLRQQLLQDAVQGKLVEQNLKDEPASELLKKIKSEKEKLIAEKKLKKEKELPPIKPEEVPFEIPENWVWCRLGEIIQYTENLDIQKRLSPETIINYIDIDAIDNQNQVIREVKQKTVGELSTRARRVLKKGYIMYSTVRPYLKNIATIDIELENFIGSTGFNVFKTILVDSNYVFNFLLTPKLNDNFKEIMIGFNSPSITNEQFEQTLIPLPPLSEQNRIVQKLDEIMQHCNELETSIKQSESQNEKLLQQVLREALRKEPVEV